MSAPTDHNGTANRGKRANSIESFADQFRSLLAMTSDGFWRFDAEGRLLDVNDAYCKMSGYTREELLKMHIADLEAVERPDEVARHIRKVTSTGFDRFDTKHRRKNGELYDLEISASYWETNNQFLLFARDITAHKLGDAKTADRGNRLEQTVQERTSELEDVNVELETINSELEEEIARREQAETALRESEADLVRAQAVGQIGSWRLDVRKNALTWSAESYRMFGIAPGAPLTYEAFLDVVHPDDREAVDRAWLAGLKGEPYSIDHRILVKGEVRWIHEQAELELDENGELRGGFGTCQDITVRKGMEKALRESEALQKAMQAAAEERQRLFGMLETLPAMVRLLKPDHHVSFANRAYRDRFGEADGRPCYEYGMGKSQPCEFCKSFEVLKTGQPFHWEVETANGVILDAYDYPFADIDGSPLVMEMDLDITEQRRAERELAKHREHLEELVQERTALLENANVHLEEEITEREHAEEQLRESEALATAQANYIQTVLETAPAIVWVAEDRESRSIIGNRASNEFLRVRQGANISKTGPQSQELRHYRVFRNGEELRPEHLPVQVVSWSGKPIISDSIDFLFDDGEWRSLEGNCAPLFDSDGNPAGAVAVYTDVTERKRAQAEVESLAKFPEENPNPVLRISKEGIVLYANPGAKPFTEEEGIAAGEPVSPFLRDLLEKALAGGGVIRTEREYPDKMFALSAAPVETGGYVNIYGRDITVRKRAEEALRQSEERFKLIATNTPDHILVQDKDLRYTWVLNPQLGLTAEDMIGKTDFDFLAEEDAAKLTTIKRRVLETGSTEYVTDTLVALNGSVQHFEGSYVPTRDDEGEISGLIGYFRNVTERRRMVEALRESEEKYRNLFESMTEEVHYWKLVRDDQGEIVTWRLVDANPPALKTWDKNLADIMGKTTDEIFGDGATEHYMPVVQKIFADQAPYSYEDYFPQLDKHFRFASVPLGEYFITTGADITPIMKANLALRESEERYRELVNNAPDAIVVHRNGEVLYANPAALQLYGAHTFEQLASRNIIERMTPDDLEVAQERLRAIMAGQVLPLRETRIVREDGREVPVEITSSPIDYQGQHAAQAIIRDITERKRAEAEVAESRRRLANIMNDTADGFYVMDTNWVITQMNDAAASYFHVKSREAVGRPLLEVFPTVRGSVFEKEFREAFGSGKSAHFEAPSVIFKRTVEMHAYPGAEGMTVLFRDVTELKRSQEELARATERMQKLLGANVIGITEFDATRIVSANKAFLDMTGYSERDVKRDRLDWRDITPPEYLERDNRAWREMIERGECLPYEKEYIRRDGKRLPILIAGVRLTEDPVTGVFLNLDITDWKLMENELIEATHFAEHLFDSNLIGLTQSDEHGLIDANDAFLEMVGHTRQELNGGLISIESMTPPEYRALDDMAWAEMLKNGETAPYEKEYIRKDGSRVPVLVGRKMIKQSPPEWIAFVLDITERKRVEGDLERMRTEFLGEVSHELKTPITAIKGCASIALSSGTPPDPAEARELFEVVDQQANRLTDLVGNVLDTTRIEAGRLSIEPSEVEVAKILDESRVIFQHSRYSSPLVVDLPDKLPPVTADSRRVVQVLTNLYSNAAKFSPPNMPVTVSAEASRDEVVIRVSDRGAGIPGDKMPLLFQKFVQIQTMGPKGTGLGLFICKGIIEAQGGRIWAESEGQGQGSTFSFSLPAAVSKRKSPPRPKRAAVPKTANGAKRIVAVDDEPQILRYVVHCLKRENYNVETTSDPLAAPKLVQSMKPDLVLLDMRLPGTSGLEVLEQIRKFTRAPVVFITATANREDVMRGKQVEETSWLEKPFTPDQLLRHVREVLGRRRRKKS
jgi:PAS domain S-box-containing protein